MATKKKPAAKSVKKVNTPTAKKAAPVAAKKAAAAAPSKKKNVASKPVAKKSAAKKAVPAKKAAPAKKSAASQVKTPAKKASVSSKPVNKKAVKKAAAPVKKATPPVKAPAKKVVAKTVQPASAQQKSANKKQTIVKKTETTNKSTKKEVAAPAKKAVKAAEPVKKAAPEVKAAPAKKAVATKAAAGKPAAVAAKPAPTPTPAPRPIVREEKKPTVIVAHRRLENKSKQTEEGGKTMINYQPEFTRSILDEPEAQTGPVYRYSDEELNEFKELIQGRLESARKELTYLQGLITRKDEAGTEDTENRYMNMEDGSGAMEREQLAQLASRQIQFINHLEKALIRIENKTYGICRVTGKLIDKARLRAVPHATLSIEAKKTMSK
jgi:RNA polymerase-binding transcription factor DksA